MLAARVLEKALRLKKRVRFRGGGKGKALLSYVIVPPVPVAGYFEASHNNRFTSFLLVKALLSLGFDVTVQDYLETTTDRQRYDLFVGHATTFCDLAQRVGARRSVLLVTGSNPAFGNAQQKARAEYLQQRRGVFIDVYGDNICPDAYPNFAAADLVLLLGNRFVKLTWFPEFQEKIWLVNNPTPVRPALKSGRSGNFVFMSSVGQVHRGLDLVLDVFRGRQERLYVCSLFDKEPEFEALYRHELYRSPNVVPCGYLRAGGRTFRRVVGDADFVILPSCSEGQSGSVVNLMARGLVPVVTENVGIPSVDDVGVRIGGGMVEDVADAVQRALSLEEEELNRVRTALFQGMGAYGQEEFCRSAAAAFSSIW